MEPIEFILWLKGFAESANEYNITPKQWDIMKQKLDDVILEAEILEEDDSEDKNQNIGYGNWYLSGTFPSHITNVKVEYIELY